MTEKELISRLQSLKQIKPNQEWVLLTKSNILNARAEASQPIVKAGFASFGQNAFKAIFRTQFVYSLAALMLVIAVGGFMIQNGLSNRIPEVDEVSLAAIKGNVEELKVKSKVLSEAVKSDPQEVQIVAKEVESVAKEIAEAIEMDPSLAKEVALEINNNETYLDVEAGTELKEASDNLCKAIIGPMINDTERLIENAGKKLAENYQGSLDNVKSLRDQGNCSAALENVLLLYIAVNQHS